MKCIIVDDEPLARNILEDFIEKIPFLQLEASCKDAFQAMDILKDNKIDLIFLDIQMPEFSGMQLYQSLHIKPQVIFTTAYSNYAVEGFEVDATDYLVKPFSFERFMKAVIKANDIKSNQYSQNSASNNFSKDFIFIKDGTKTIKLLTSDILFMESMKDYIKVYTTTTTAITLMSMQMMLDLLPSNLFARVHRSYIVSLPKIDTIQRNRIVIGDKWIPIGNLYKEDFFKKC